jgi:hypothetical protein
VSNFTAKLSFIMIWSLFLGRRDGRPKRKRAPVVRLSYDTPKVRPKSERRHEQYSSEEEFRGKKERVSRRKKSSRSRNRYVKVLVLNALS